jgi:hypothetical protein
MHICWLISFGKVTKAFSLARPAPQQRSPASSPSADPSRSAFAFRCSCHQQVGPPRHPLPPDSSPTELELDFD